MARQDRVDPGKGNIAGQDIGPTAGFAIFSLNAAWRFSKAVTLTGGVDNVFDRTYAEHLSRTGAMVPGYLQTTRVNEPGRTVWLKTTLLDLTGVNTLTIKNIQDWAVPPNTIAPSLPFPSGSASFQSRAG